MVVTVVNPVEQIIVYEVTITVVMGSGAEELSLVVATGVGVTR